MTTRFLRMVTVTVAVVGPGSIPLARAFVAADSPCYATAPVWNAPKGAIVSGISSGPISAIIGAIGESRTHTMISQGDWATHSTTLVPSTTKVKVTALGLITLVTIPNPSMPFKPVELAEGYPGLSQINMGGAFAYWQDAEQVFTQTQPRFLPSPGLCSAQCKAEGTADWLWSDVPYQAVNAVGDGFTSQFYSLGYNDARGGGFVHLPYDFHQYMNGLLRVRDGMDVSSVGDRGIVCSEVPAWAYSHWYHANQPKVRAGSERIVTFDYTHEQTAAAAAALVNSVYNECKGNEGGFWNALWFILDPISNLIASATKEQICVNAAYQVLNCFLNGEELTGGGCKNVSSAPYNLYVANSSLGGARSLSPDDLMGLSGRPVDVSRGPWVEFLETSLQWNGGGSTYGCFE